MTVRETLRIHNNRWIPSVVEIKPGAPFRFPGVEYMVNGKERSQFEYVKAKLRGILAVVHVKQAIPATLFAILCSSTISEISYIGALAPWPLA